MYPERDLRANEDDDRLQHVASKLEKRIDGLLGLGFRFAARGQEERMASGALNRIVGAVLEHLRDADDGEDRNEGNRRIADQGDDRKDEQRAADADVLEYSRYQKGLKQKADNV